MPSEPPILKLEGVTKRYDSPDRIGSLTVLDGISLELGRGESLAIVGPSGSGKSTLLQIIGTLDHPTSGSVRLEGQDLSGLDEAKLAEVRNRRIGFVFQAHYLLPQCTVLENVLVPTLAAAAKPKRKISRGTAEGGAALETGAKTKPLSPLVPRGEREKDGASSEESAEDRAQRLLKRVGLGERQGHRPGELSGGERQRVAVVRALINQPQLLLADEPTGSLDHASAQELGQLLMELNHEEGVTLVVVTHSPELARRMVRVMELKDGKLVMRDA
jgi:ABC-type lipoprotein export system ATPase subunit